MYCTRAVLPGMVERGRGQVINIGSIAATYPYPGGNVYGATKAFVRQFGLNLRSDLHGTGVRVTTIEPGMCGGTEFSVVRFNGNAEEAGKAYAGMQPLTADDITATVQWAASQPAHVNINTMNDLHQDLFEVSSGVRYVALASGQHVAMCTRPGLQDASSADSEPVRRTPGQPRLAHFGKTAW